MNARNVAISSPDPSDLQVVIMAGGLGTRLGALGEGRPKIMQPVCGTPFLDILLNPIVDQGFRRFAFCLGHLADQVIAYLESKWSWLSISILTDGNDLGVAGALAAQCHHLDEAFLLLLGDTFTELDYLRLWRILDPSALGVIVATDKAPDQAGELLFDGERLVSYDKTLDQTLGKQTPWVDTGTAVLRRTALGSIVHEKTPADLPALFNRLISQNALLVVKTHQVSFDIGTPQRLARFADYYSERLKQPKDQRQSKPPH